VTRQFSQFEATPGGMELTNAILLYKGAATPDARRAQEPAFASIHSVERVDGMPTIAAGAPLSRTHLRLWTELLGRTVAPEILPENVLVSHADILAWWVPEKVRPSYFDLTNPPEGLKVLAERTTVTLPYPAHLFVATRNNLWVYALPTSARPSADTVLLYSPVLNVYIEGDLCWGNIPQPKSITAAAMPEYERAVFDSWSTHPNHGQEMTVTGKGGLVRLWDDLAARRASRFPVKRLKPFRLAGASTEPVTLGRLIAEIAR
jgi:PRTRC genetic system protein B